MRQASRRQSSYQPKGKGSVKQILCGVVLVVPLFLLFLVYMFNSPSIQRSIRGTNIDHHKEKLTPFLTGATRPPSYHSGTASTAPSPDSPGGPVNDNHDHDQGQGQGQGQSVAGTNTLLDTGNAGPTSKPRLGFNEDGIDVATVTANNPPQASRYAYLTLISGIDSRFRYRGFLYNALIMKRALVQLKSRADFVAMIGFSEADISPFQSDIDLLKSHGIIVFVLPRLIHGSHALNFAEMALLKITPYSFTQYDKVQFFDGDVMPIKNMDCFFDLKYNTFTLGAVSPLNSGWFLGIPDSRAYQYMLEKAIWRLGRDWDPTTGWKEAMPRGMVYRGGKQVEEWLFNGADMDQGLFAHYFPINHGKSILIDTQLQTAKLFEKGILERPPFDISIAEALGCCGGISPMAFYAHFTGRSKPWVRDLTKEKSRGFTAKWVEHLDALNLPINSKNIANLSLASPLGYFNARFPKGGYKAKTS